MPTHTKTMADDGSNCDARTTRPTHTTSTNASLGNLEGYASELLLSGDTHDASAYVRHFSTDCLLEYENTSSPYASGKDESNEDILKDFECIGSVTGCSAIIP